MKVHTGPAYRQAGNPDKTVGLLSTERIFLLQVFTLKTSIQLLRT